MQIVTEQQFQLQSLIMQIKGRNLGMAREPPLNQGTEQRGLSVGLGEDVLEIYYNGPCSLPSRF